MRLMTNCHWRVSDDFILATKVGCVFPMVVIPILPQAEFGPNDHREDAPHFILRCLKMRLRNSTTKDTECAETFTNNDLFQYDK